MSDQPAATESQVEAVAAEETVAALPVELTDEQKAAIRRQARDAVHRCLGNPTGQADAMVGELTVDEQQRIVAAAGDRDTARDAIKQVLTDAYERRRKEHEAVAQDTRARHDRRDAVRLALFEAGAPREDVAAFLAAMREEDATAVLEIAAPDRDEQVQALFKAVMARPTETETAAATVSPELEPGWKPEDEAKFQNGVSREEVSGDVEESSETAPASPEATPDAPAAEDGAAPSAEPVPEPAPAAEAPAAEPAAPKPAAKKPTPKR